MAAKDKRVQEHVSGEKTPCAECRAEIALLRRAQELKDQEGLEGRALVEGVMKSLADEDKLEEMWSRRAKTPKRR